MSSSYQIEADISGSWKGQSLISSSYQIEADISGSWKTNQSLLSSSAQIKNDISGAVTFQTQSIANKVNLSNLKVVNYSTDIFTTVIDGELVLTFGVPAEASVTSQPTLGGYNSTRFNLVPDDYTLNWNINLNGATFNSGAFFRNNTLIETSATEGDCVGSVVKNITNDVGNASWVVKVNYTKADSTKTDIITNAVAGTISTPVPGSPTISHDFSNATPDGTSMLVSSKLEKYVGGTYSYSSTEASNRNGYEVASTQFNNPTGTNKSIHNTNAITEEVTEFFVSPDGAHSSLINTSTDDSFTIDRMISLRTGSLPSDTIAATDGNASGIISLTNWKANVGSVVYGTRLSYQIDDITMNFNPEPTAGEYLYIVYDDNQNDLSAITNQDANTNDLGTEANPKGWRKLDSINGYKIYRSDNLNFNPTRYKVTFS